MEYWSTGVVEYWVMKFKEFTTKAQRGEGAIKDEKKLATKNAKITKL